jgi:hypothetical protein
MCVVMIATVGSEPSLLEMVGAYALGLVAYSAVVVMSGAPREVKALRAKASGSPGAPA